MNRMNCKVIADVPGLGRQSPEYSEEISMEPRNDLALRKFVAPEFIYGAGSRLLAGQYARNFNARKVLVVTDPGVATAGWTRQVIASLEEEQLEYTVFSDVSPNPRAEEVMAGVGIYRAEACHAIVAVGGGSPIDCAKGIGIVCSNRGHILDYEGVDNVAHPIDPLICIPTTAGSSADVSQFGIICDTRRKVKIAIISKAVVPDVSLIDPEVLTTMGAYLTACSGMDALVHAIEAFVSNASSPVTDIHALEAIRLISGNLVQSVRFPDNLDLRGKIMLGSLEAGLAFSNASLGCVHAMSHALGGLLDLAHGECNALLLRHVMAYNFDHAPERYQLIGNAMGIDMKGLSGQQKRDRILGQVDTLRGQAGIVQSLGSRMSSSDIPYLARNAMADACMATNPRHPDLRDIEVIYEEAL